MPARRRPRPPARRPTARPGRRPITAEDLTKIVLVSDPQISPDGESVVYVRQHVGTKNNYVRNLWLVAAGGGESRAFTSGERDGHPRWSPDGGRIAFLSGRDKSDMQIYTISPAGGEATKLTCFPEGSFGTFRWSPDGSMLAVSFRESDPEWTDAKGKERQAKGLSDPPRVLDDWWYRLDGDGYFNAQRYHLYIVDMKTGKHRKVFDKDNMGIFTFDWSPDSKELVISANLGRRAMVRVWEDAIFRLHVKRGRLTRLPNLPEGPKTQVTWSPDGRFVAWAGRVGRIAQWDANNIHLFCFDLERGKVKNLTGGTDYCLTAATLSDMAEAAFDPVIRWSRDSRRIYVRLGTQGEGHLASVARSGGELTFHTSGEIECLPGNFTARGDRLTLLAGGPLRPPEIQVATVRPGEFRRTPLTDANGALFKELDVVKPVAHWVRTPDRTKVQVWVMKPRVARRKVPAILEIHGGPHAQYGVSFFHEMQLLVAQGYAVFYSNPRGSKGYGEAHCNAIQGCWGGPDWVDMRAVIDFMRSQPWVDTKRMGVMGGSYGGYMTNWAVGHCRDFKAAITDRCVSNMVSMLGNTDFTEAPDYYWPGNTWDRPEKLWEMSPLKYLGRARTPMLIIHSEGDLRCNIEQSEQVFTVMKLRGIPCRFVRYPRSTSHGMSRGGPPDMRLHRLGQIVDWWKRWLGR